MPNPLYDVLPRMHWITASAICQHPQDFTFDEASQSTCCPSPTYCCPNSLTSCDQPGAVRFDAIDDMSIRHDDAAETIIRYWPHSHDPPTRWEMTPRSYVYVATLLLNASITAESKNVRDQAYRRAVWLLKDAFVRGHLAPASYREMAAGLISNYNVAAILRSSLS